MCHPIPGVAVTHRQSDHSCPAQLLGPEQRQELALEALAGAQAITQLAEDHHVSRKFVYQQSHKATEALEQAFAPAPPADDQVLFHLPVTKRWLRRLIVALLLICHCPYRGVLELLGDLFGYSTSVGTIHNIVCQAVEQARVHNQQASLSQVGIGAHDEIYQNRLPVLVGVDVASTYCYLLSLEEHCDGVTWGVRLLELCARGFDPEAIIGDGGSGLQAGQDLALPAKPRRGDVFHALKEYTTLVTFLENRAYQAIATRSKLERQQAASEHRRGRPDRSVGQKLRHARAAEIQALDLTADVATLGRWLQQDILALAGPCYDERIALYDFVVAELQARQPLCPYRIGPLCTYLVNQRDALLAFAKQLDVDLHMLAEEFQLPVDVVRAVFAVQDMDPHNTRRWHKEAPLRQQLRGRFHELSEAVTALARRTVRASSVVENVNSRLRNYFFLRRHLGPDYLQLLQFFLNHRRFPRSDHPERVGKSPAELLTGQTHPHWLDMLGFGLPSRN
jgi:hypothetical protein